MESTNNVSLAGGAQLVRDIFPGIDPEGYAGSYPRLADRGFNGQLLFTAIDEENGRELWVSDGTEAGTQLLLDIRPGSSDDGDPYSSNIAFFNYGSFSYNALPEINGQVFFTADDGETGRELWISDGTAEGTQLLLDINPGSATSSVNDVREFNGQLIFTADDGETGDELWVSDGTAEGTQLLLDINPGTDAYYDSSSPFGFTEANGQLFFRADDGETGRELWVSDGTAEGTQLLLDIEPGSGGSYPRGFTEFNGQVFFEADDGETGDELWVSDGTADGTQLLIDIRPGRAGSSPTNLTEFNGQLFFSANDGENGRELWVSDGTADGTQLLLDINPGVYSRYDGSDYPNSSDVYNLTEVNGLLFFTADNGETGAELWVSDGTASGTQLLRDINPNNDFDDSYSYDPYPDSPTNLTAAGDLLFFTADNAVNGRELWVSDGTTEGTQLFQDINPGVEGSYSYPGNLTVVGDQLFFTADDGTTGQELWVAKIPDNIISGDENNNSFTGTADVDLINGFAGNDLLLGRGGGDIINGGAGRDEIIGNRGSDRLTGGAGNDQISGGFGDDTLVGGNGSDQLMGANGQDSLQGGLGQDTLQGGGQNDFLSGGSGHDLLLGSAGQDTLLGSLGNDNLGGGIGNDQLVGGTERDTLNGGTGQDTLIGGAGNDELVGGNGQDQFKFNSFNDGSDTIADFEVGIDTIDLSSIFVASRFESATPFADYIQLIQVDSDTQVQIDRNGDDAGGVFTTIATLDNIVATELDSSSFLL